MRGLLTVPNALTLARLALAPLIARSILASAPRDALALLLIAGTTDGLDGFLARRYRWVSVAGAYLDPIADKALMAATYVSLGFAGLLPWWLIALVFGRDALILLGALILMAAKKRREFRPTLWGKASTFFQLSAALLALAAAAFPSLPLTQPAALSLIAAGAATVWSGLHYSYTALFMPSARP